MEQKYIEVLDKLLARMDKPVTIEFLEHNETHRIKHIIIRPTTDDDKVIHDGEHFAYKEL